MDYHPLFDPYVKNGKRTGNGQITGLCPFHDDRNPSFSWNEQTGVWICFAKCGSGNAYQFAERNGLDPKPYLTSQNRKIDHVPAKKREKLSSGDKQQAGGFHKYLLEHLSELSGEIPNSWTEEDIRRTLTGFDPKGKRLVFQHTDLSGEIVNIKYHKDPEGRVKQRPGIESILFPLKLVPEYDPEKPLIYCEGEKDAVTLISQGFQAITGSTGAGTLPKDLTPLKPFKNIIILYDAGKAGEEGSQKLAYKLRNEFPKMNVKLHFWDNKKDGFDVTDFFQNGNSVIDLYNSLLKAETFRPSSGNWFKKHRNLNFDGLIKNPDMYHTYGCLEEMASHKREYKTWRTGRGLISVQLKPGQLLFGSNRTAKKLGVNPRTLLNRIKRLEKWGMIEISTSNQYTIVTICNWET